MRRLWVQLSLAFGLVIIVSALLFVVIGRVTIESQIYNIGDDIIEDSVTRLNAQVESGASDRQLESFVRDLHRDSNRLPLPIEIQFAYIDANGNTLFDRLKDNSEIREATITAGGILQYQIIQRAPRSSQPNLGGNSARGNPIRPPEILSPEETLLALTVIGGILGIIASILMSRRLAAPLSELATTARQFGGRKFDLRADVKGTEEVRDVARAFNQMANNLQESEQLRNNLIADVAHELRTPLTVMESNLRALIDGVHTLSEREVFTLYNQTRQLSRLVNDLHELSLADAHELPLYKTPVDLVALVEDVIDIFGAVAEAEEIAVDVNLPTSPLIVKMDTGRIKQVLQNLLVNALRHTPEGGTITLDLRCDNETAILIIRDTGEGIPAHDIEHIFERFYRADRSRDRTSGGAGLGLAIGKAIIEGHNGEISVQSSTQLPSGTAFTIQLPLHQAR